MEAASAFELCALMNGQASSEKAFASPWPTPAAAYQTIRCRTSSSRSSLQKRKPAPASGFGLRTESCKSTPDGCALPVAPSPGPAELCLWFSCPHRPPWLPPRQLNKISLNKISSDEIRDRELSPRVASQNV